MATALKIVKYTFTINQASFGGAYTMAVLEAP